MQGGVWTGGDFGSARTRRHVFSLGRIAHAPGESVPVAASPSTARTRHTGLRRGNGPNTADAFLEASPAIQWEIAGNDGHATGLHV